MRYDTTRSSESILDDLRSHRARLKGDPKVAHLVPILSGPEAQLRSALLRRQAVEETREELYIRFVSTDEELDDLVRVVELEVLIGVGKDREAPAYKAAFGDGLKAITRLRGEKEAEAIRVLRSAVGRHFPAVEARHGKDLERLAKAATESENAFERAEGDLAEAFSQEVDARVALLAAMRRSEAGILSVYPGQRARVARYFPQERARKPKPSSEAASA